MIPLLNKDICVSQMEQWILIEQNLTTIDSMCKRAIPSNNGFINGMTTLFLEQNPNLNIYSFEKGLDFAIKEHEGQFRDSRTPYVSHSIQTSYLINVWKISEDAIISALLHDVVEQKPEQKKELFSTINKFFGKIISKNIETLSTFEENRNMRDINHAKKILNHYSNTNNSDVLFIRCADVISNLLTKQFMLPKNGYSAEQRQLIYSENVIKHVLPIVQKADSLNIIDFNLETYIHHLATK